MVKDNYTSKYYKLKKIKEIGHYWKRFNRGN